MSRVLVVEDEPAIAELVAIHLRHAGFEVALAADGDAAATSVDRVLPGNSTVQTRAGEAVKDRLTKEIN